MHGFKTLLASKVSSEKSAVILMRFPFYVTYDFSLPAFNTRSLFCMQNPLTITYYGDLFFGLVYLLSCVLLVSMWVYLFFVWESFLFDLVDDIAYAIHLGVFLPHLCLYFKDKDYRQKIFNVRSTLQSGQVELNN